MLAGIVIAFVFTVDQHVGMGSPAIHVTHILMQSPEKLVLDERIDSIIVPPAKHDGLEAFNVERKEWILQPARTVLAAEVKSKGKFCVAAP